MSRRSVRTVLIAAYCLFLLTGCDERPIPPTSILVGDGNSFTLHGQGRLALFKVYGPSSGKKVADPFDERSVVWQIEAPKRFLAGLRIESLRLTYGTVPKGYTQTVPFQSQAPPKILRGNIYSFSAVSDLAGNLGGDFYVDETQGFLAVNVDNCGRLIEGRVIRGSCESDEPFKEPADMQEFIRYHQRKCPFTPPEPGFSNSCSD